jgi:flavin-binding protein dodecin
MVHVAKIVEIVGSSTKGWEDAAQVAVDEAKKTKQILWDKIEDMLEIAGYNVAKIKQDLPYESESDMIITSNSRK